MSEPRLVLHLREGVHARVSETLPGVEILPYPVGAPFSELVARARAAEADVHCFGDLVPGPLVMQPLLRLLARRGMRAAVTPATPSLHQLGFAPVAGGSGIGVQILPCHVLPGWFSAIPTGLLEEFGFFAGEEETLDFRLLRLSRTLAAAEVPVQSIGTPMRELDERLWARNTLLAQEETLARDFARCTEPTAVPHQLRVRPVGEWRRETPTPVSTGPLISLLCPAYKPDFVEEMIASVLAQGYQNWELLLLVDGPPAPSRAAYEALLAKYGSEPRIRAEFQENAGTGITRQRLFEWAHGEYVMFIDDDDTLAPACLGSFAACLLEDPALDVLRAGAQLFGLVNREMPPRPRVMVDGVSASLFEVNQPFCVRRALIASFGGLHGDPGFGGVGEDSDLFLRLDHAGARTALLPQALYGRRLSTLNQSLRFAGGSFTKHVQTLIRRQTLAGWSLDALTFNLEAGFVKQSAIYRAADGPRVLHCPTRYFNYNTLGDAEPKS